MLAMKSVTVAAGLASAKVATEPLNAAPSVAGIDIPWVVTNASNPIPEPVGVVTLPPESLTETVTTKFPSG